MRCAVDEQSSGERAVIAPGSQHGDSESNRLPAAAALLAIALPHHARIDADARIVDEDASVHLSDVDHLCVAGHDRVDGLGRIERDPKVLGEVVQCAGGQDAQGGTGFNRNGRDRVDGPVPSGCDQRISPARRAPCSGGEVAAMPDSLERYFGTSRTEQLLELHARVLTGCGTGRFVDDETDSRGRGTQR